MFKKEKEEVIHFQAHFKKNQKIREYSSHISKVHSVDWSADGSKLSQGPLKQMDGIATKCSFSQFASGSKEIEIIHRLFLVIAMYCQASSMNH